MNNSFTPRCTFEDYPDERHSSHDTRVSDTSSFDEICKNCGRTDRAGGGWGGLRMPCPKTKMGGWK